MYSVFEPRETISVKVWDKDKDRKGFIVTYRDGSTGYVTAKDLNMSKPHFRRLYYDLLPDSQTVATAPSNQEQGNIETGTINRWIRELDQAEHRFAAERDWRMFWVFNKTLRHEPFDQKFIIRIEADHQNLSLIHI